MRIRFEHLPIHVMFAQSHVNVNKEMWRVGRSCGHGERVRAMFVPCHVAVVGEKQHEISTKLQVDLPSGGGAEPSDIFDVALFPFGP